MDKVELLKRACMAGLRINFVKTVDEGYVKGYMVEKATGITVGRSTLYSNEYLGTKWYGEKYLGAPDDYNKINWRYAIANGKPLDEKFYYQVKIAANELRDADHEDKQAWRDANPKSGSHQRPKLQKKHLGRLIARMLLELEGAYYEQETKNAGLQRL